MTKTKGPHTSIRSMDEADAVLMELSELHHTQREVQDWVTEQEQEAREKAKARLLLDKKSGETVADRIAKLSVDLLAYIDLNRGSFTDKRSIDLAHGTIGIRLGQHKVDTIGKITIKAIMMADVMTKKLRLWGWIAEKPALDKAKIIEDFKDAEVKTQAKLRQVSLTVKQEDEPWFETREADLAAGKAAA